jgi:hypothetical protein
MRQRFFDSSTLIVLLHVGDASVPSCLDPLNGMCAVRSGDDKCVNCEAN